MKLRCVGHGFHPNGDWLSAAGEDILEHELACAIVDLGRAGAPWWHHLSPVDSPAPAGTLFSRSRVPPACPVDHPPEPEEQRGPRLPEKSVSSPPIGTQSADKHEVAVELCGVGLEFPAFSRLHVKGDFLSHGPARAVPRRKESNSIHVKEMNPSVLPNGGLCPAPTNSFLFPGYFA